MAGVKALPLILVFSALGGFFKILGGVLYGSKAVFVDALTSIANLIALLLAIKYWRSSLEPPDEDHHFGHHKLAFGGSILTLMAYSFVAGVVTLKLLDLREYSISLNAPLMAFLGVICYLVSIIISRRFSIVFTHYSTFTVSELIEGAVVVSTSLVGALYSYLIDYSGAVLLTLYIFYELRKVFTEVLGFISDVAPPRDLINVVKEEFVRNGLSLSELRLRRVDDRRYQGMAYVLLKPDENLTLASSKVDAIKDALRNYGVELVIEFRPGG